MSLEMDPDPTDSAAVPVSLYSWGRADLGCLLNNDDHSTDGIYQLSFHGQRKIIQIASNTYHTAAVTSTGDVYTAGANYDGQVNPSNKGDSTQSGEEILKPRIFDLLGQHRICSVACGASHTVCVTAAGTAISFGSNDSGQLGHSTQLSNKFHVAPRTVEFKWRSKSELVQDAVCGDSFSVFLMTSGEIYSCGSGSCTGHPTGKTRTIAERVDSMAGLYVTKLAAGSAHCLLLTATQSVYGFGHASHGQLGLPDVEHIQIPTRIPLAWDSESHQPTIIGLAAGYSHSLIWSDSGVLLGSGSNKYGQVGLLLPRVTTFTQIPLPENTPICKQAACGSNHSIAYCSSADNRSSQLLGWGSNNFRQVNNSTAILHRQPIALSTPPGVLFIAAGGDQSFVAAVATSTSSSPTSFSTHARAFSAGVIDEHSNSEAQDYMAAARASMQRQFSRQASRAPEPLASSRFSQLVATITQVKETDGSSSREFGRLLTSICDVFASSSLLGGSFVDLDAPELLSLDIAAIESCYKSLLSLGQTVVVRLINAMQLGLCDLDATAESHQLSEAAIRSALIIWQCPLSSNAVLSADYFTVLVRMCSKLPEQHKQLLMETLAKYPHHVLGSRMLRSLQEHLTHVLDVDIDYNALEQSRVALAQPVSYTGMNIARIQASCELLTLFYHMNQRYNLVKEDLFYNAGLSGLPIRLLLHDLWSWRKSQQQQQQQQQSEAASSNGRGGASRPRLSQPFYFCQYRHLISVETKRSLIQAVAVIEQDQAQRLAATASMIPSPYFILMVQRQQLLHQTMHILDGLDKQPHQQAIFKRPLKVIFDGEEGIDEGGVKKEFFQLIVAQVMSADYGLFTPTANFRTMWINKLCKWCNDEYHLVGVLFGLGFYNAVLLDFHFPLVLYKKLLGQPVGLSDLADIDPELSKGLQQLLEFEPSEQVEDIFCRDFTVEWDDFGETRTHELIPHGATIPVTGANRQEYVNYVVKWYLEDSIKEQFDRLHQGFSKVVDMSLLKLLEPAELESAIVGMRHLDFTELEQHTEYISGDPNVTWNASNNAVKWFWETVRAMSFEEKQKFLLFVSGSAKAPLGGLKNLGLKIQRMCGDTNCLPTAHTCFNLLMLPEYASKEKLKTLLLRSIVECEGFGLK